MKGQLLVITAIIFTIIITIFAIINIDPVAVNYLFGAGHAPLILVILFSLLMGGLITAAVGMKRVFHLQREIRALKSENQQLQMNLGGESIGDNMNEDIETITPKKDD